jgi:hypothetical protein
LPLHYGSTSAVVAERLLPIRAIWNDWLGSMLIQFLAQLGAIMKQEQSNLSYWLSAASPA